MRKGFDTLAALVKDFLGQDPLSGHLFLFVGRAKDRLKILYWDADGFALWYKRLEEGTFRLPRVSGDDASVELKASELAMMLEGIDLHEHQAEQAILADAQECVQIPDAIVAIFRRGLASMMYVTTDGTQVLEPPQASPQRPGRLPCT